MKNLYLFLPICLLLQTALVAQNPSIAQKVENMQHLPGFFDLYYDQQDGRLWIKIDRVDKEFIYNDMLRTGIGSNDIGLDRGRPGNNRLVKFTRAGAKLLLTQVNTGYRAENTGSATEKRAVQEAFAISVLWGFKIEAQSGDGVLVDATDFLLTDVHGVANDLSRSGQGKYQVNASRSAIDMTATRSFPGNSEISVLLTFSGKADGREIATVAPNPEAISVYIHHSFAALPEPGFVKRRLDPRGGFFGIRYLDYSVPIEEELRQQYICRFRLQKTTPGNFPSEVVEPIVFYVDHGAPEPIRSALLDGARWWAEAFEAAGFLNAFRVEVLPDSIDPMDIRYNVIQWVHRSTRGWSYGSTMIDPRTGEIMKGHVNLGSLRVRQDFLIAEGLLSPYKNRDNVDPRMKEMALARLRQLSAHEVGHTLGLNHNFAASFRKRASVMDYPYPDIFINPENRIDFSRAYASGIGDWDKLAIKYGYSEFDAKIDLKKALSAIIEEGSSRNLYLISDADARPAGGAHPEAHLWDNGQDAVSELSRIMQLREKALFKLSEQSIPYGTPLAHLEETLVPIYFYHRYQIEAAAKVLGGLDYRYAIRGDGQPVTRLLTTSQQLRALTALLETVDPDVLMLPELLLQSIPPRIAGDYREREVFNRRTGLTFDPLAAAEAAANLTFRMLLHPQRLSRLVVHHARDNRQPSLQEVLTTVLDATWKKRIEKGYAGEVQKVVNMVLLYHLMKLAQEDVSSISARAEVLAQLQELQKWLNDRDDKPLYLLAARLLEQFRKNPLVISAPIPVEAPAGSPIGAGFSCDFDG